MGNVASVKKALDKLGFPSVITDNPDEIRQSDFILLPGVGSFAVGMENLHLSGLVELLTDEVCQRKKPFLGICLGMQLLADYGHEPHKIKGLGWIRGEVVKMQLPDHLRIPHLGWNNVQVVGLDNHFFSEFSGKDYYFIHSYHLKAKDSEDVVLTADYGIPIVAAVRKNNIFATQFHPEKSQNAGLALLNKVIKLNAQM